MMYDKNNFALNKKKYVFLKKVTNFFYISLF